MPVSAAVTLVPSAAYSSRRQAASTSRGQSGPGAGRPVLVRVRFLAWWLSMGASLAALHPGCFPFPARPAGGLSVAAG